MNTMPSILDDKLVSVRLAAQPEFHVRLVEFLHSYGIMERPALVVQARPAHGSALVRVNLDDLDVQKRFLAGISTDNGWWQGFRSMVAAKRTFHGIASLPARDEPNWASEVHHDGHFIAGIWTFLELPAGDKRVQAVADFYVEMFVDFLRLVESTLQGVSERPAYEATWTLVHTPKLHYAGVSWAGQRTITAAPVQIEHLQWVIATASVRTQEWKQLGVRMGEALVGAYGDVRQSVK